MNEQEPKHAPPKEGPRRSNPLATGNVLVGNILVGLGLGWLVQHFVPGLKPWGYAAGIILGFASGLWQILKSEGLFKAYQPKQGKDDAGPRQL